MNMLSLKIKGKGRVITKELQRKIHFFCNIVQRFAF